MCSKINAYQQSIPLYLDPNVASVTVFLPNQNHTRLAILVCPGGSYSSLSLDREGVQIAQWLNSIDIAAFVLKYRVSTDPNKILYPDPLIDAATAMSLIRSRATEFSIDPNRLGIMGFSAGGHLASTLATHHNSKVLRATLISDQNYKSKVANLKLVHPDFQILIYPVITFKDPYAHHDSRKNLLGSDSNAAIIDDLSNDNSVDGNTPPAFIVHGLDDSLVPVENSLCYFSALRRANIPVELHIFPHGRHGFALNYDAPPWTPLLQNWLNNLCK